MASLEPLASPGVLPAQLPKLLANSHLLLLLLLLLLLASPSPINRKLSPNSTGNCPSLTPQLRPHRPSRAPSQPRRAPNPSRPSDTLQSIWRRSWRPFSGAALLSGFLGFYIIGTAAASLKTRPCQASCEHAAPTGRPPALTGDNAEQFDKELDLPERWMGITKLRKKLAGHAKGHVLELAVGTGQTLNTTTGMRWAGRTQRRGSRPPPGDILVPTGLDISADMLDVARKRLVAAVPPVADSEPSAGRSALADHTGGRLSLLNDRMRLICSDAHRPLPQAAGAGATYDTIIQTFGLCSVSDPVAVLCNLASTVKPDTGRIILLEHGKGWYGLVNGLLDKNAEKHFEKYGCWWNRDIEALVDEAVQKTPGLEIVKLDRPNIMQMGTLVWVELRMRGKR